jgi:hypothetical protein
MVRRISLIVGSLLVVGVWFAWSAHAQTEPDVTIEIIDTSGNVITDSARLCVTVISGDGPSSLIAVCDNDSTDQLGGEWGRIGLITGRKPVTVMLSKLPTDYELAPGSDASIDVPPGQSSVTVTFTLERDITSGLETRIAALEAQVAELEQMVTDLQIQPVESAPAPVSISGPVTIQCGGGTMDVTVTEHATRVTLDIFGGYYSDRGATLTGCTISAE